MVARADRPPLTSRNAIREAILEYRDGRTRRVPICEPAPATIIECATLEGLIEPGYERGQRRFGWAGAERSDTPRYVEREVITAAFRCGACGCAPGLVYLPRSDEFGRLHDALPTSISGVRWQLCWPCYAAWARTAPARPANARLPAKVAQAFGWVAGAPPEELRRAYTRVAARMRSALTGRARSAAGAHRASH